MPLEGETTYGLINSHAILDQKSRTSPVLCSANLVTMRVPIFSLAATSAGFVRSMPLKNPPSAVSAVSSADQAGSGIARTRW